MTTKKMMEMNFALDFKEKCTKYDGRILIEIQFKTMYMNYKNNTLK